MKTTITKNQDIERKWYIIDAKDKTLGRMATIIADKLRGKDKPNFSPHMDCGDYIVVINAEKIKLSGNKMRDKIYYRHSGYPGGLKQESAEQLIVRKPTVLVEKAVLGMLPKNRLRNALIQKLKIFKGEEHTHTAQKPETLEIK